MLQVKGGVVVECNPASYVTFLIIFSGATPQQSQDNLMAWFDRVAAGILPPGCCPCYGDGGGVISGIYHRMTATQSSEFELKIAVKLEQWTARCLVNGISAGSLFKVQGQGVQIAVSTVIIGLLRDHWLGFQLISLAKLVCAGSSESICKVHVSLEIMCFMWI